MQNVESLRGGRVSAEEIIEFGATRVVLATGAHWRRDGVGRAHTAPIRGFDGPGRVLTPDDVQDGAACTDPVVIYDDDHYYLGAVLAEKLLGEGRDVTLVTPADKVSAWTVNTLEQHTIQRRLLESGVRIVMNQRIVAYEAGGVTLHCVYTGRESALPAGCVVSVTSRQPDEELHDALLRRSAAADAAGIVSIACIGDCLAPGTIAAAVYAGHRHAREFDRAPGDEVAFRREMILLDPIND
jgi:dimethylamine/trimethylamine dehydrogenase